MNHLFRLVFAEKAVGGDEMLGANDDFLAGSGFNVLLSRNPVRIR